MQDLNWGVLAHDPLSSLAYPMITQKFCLQKTLIASNGQQVNMQQFSIHACTSLSAIPVCISPMTDQSYHQGNLFNITLWLRQYLDITLCMVQLTTTDRCLAQWSDSDTTLVVPLQQCGTTSLLSIVFVQTKWPVRESTDFVAWIIYRAEV